LIGWTVVGQGLDGVILYLLAFNGRWLPVEALWQVVISQRQMPIAICRMRKARYLRRRRARSSTG
jgi:hypothetical protein